jgi:ribonuclease P protein component
VEASNDFPKKSRLLNSTDFNYFRQDSVVFRCPSFIVLFKSSRLELNSARLGLSVSRKAGKANIRNFLKRRFRENFRFFLKTFPIDMQIIVARPFYSKGLSREERSLRLSLFKEHLAQLNKFVAKRF